MNPFFVQLQQSILTIFIPLFVFYYLLTLFLLLNFYTLLSMTGGPSQASDCFYTTTGSMSWTYTISISRSFAGSMTIPYQDTLDTTKLWNWCNEITYSPAYEAISLTIASPVQSANGLRLHATIHIELFNNSQFQRSYGILSLSILLSSFLTALN